jgi:aspartyl-tRNA(Asn)/glutamyl-tRNA(Gln) amidotransferase subunit C
MPGIHGQAKGKRKKMAHIIDDATIEYVGILAQLELDQKETEAAKKDMGRMLDYIDKLNELDTHDVEPMSHVFPVHNIFREDIVENGDDRTNILKNAPESKDGAFKVPKTVE